MPFFSQKSKDKLATADPRLQTLFNEVIKYFDCTILCGHRTAAEEADFVRQGKSQTLRSKHLLLPSLAVDVAPYPVDWGNTGTLSQRVKAINRFYLFAGFVLGLAKKMNIPIRWGGDWDCDTDIRDQTFDDLSHFEINHQ